MCDFEQLATVVDISLYTNSSEWKLFRFDKTQVNDFAFLLIGVTFKSRYLMRWKNNKEHHCDRRL